MSLTRDTVSDILKLIINEKAVEDLDGMDNGQRDFFLKHINKIAVMPPRRHMKYGIPYHVEEVGQGRLIYDMEDEVLTVIRCFSTHKEYEKWFRSYK